MYVSNHLQSDKLSSLLNKRLKRLIRGKTHFLSSFYNEIKNVHYQVLSSPDDFGIHYPRPDLGQRNKRSTSGEVSILNQQLRRVLIVHYHVEYLRRMECYFVFNEIFNEAIARIEY